MTFEKTLVSLVENRRWASVKDVLKTMNPADAAAVLDRLEPEVLPILFRLLPKDTAGDCFAEMEPETQEAVLRGLADGELRQIMEELYTDDAAALVEEMPPAVVERILSAAGPEKRQLINQILQYPEDSAGSIMTTEFVRLTPSMTVEQAIGHIRETGLTRETINTCYVTDPQGVLVGILSIRMLIVSDGTTQVSVLMEPRVISVGTLEDQETAANMLARYNFVALPVVDGEKRLVGIVTVDDAMDVLVEETTEDMAKMAAITPTDRPYLRTPVWQIWRSRIPWLLILMISATFTGLIITRFEQALAACGALMAYVPMLMDTGGNSGSQSSVTVIRGLSLGEVACRDAFRVMWKETRVAVLCGGTMAAVNFAKLMLLDRVGLAVALVVCLTLVTTVLVAKLVGGLLPILAKKAGLDPAVCASPFITTIVDALSLILYFQTASAVLGL